ncbi:MAG TPA: HEAT repeat domain-containing protein [Verrucomicrobiae bacterium]|nr:HEAT repeat domain-containing protein [Verrucomicrobiae bacterium]
MRANRIGCLAAVIAISAFSQAQFGSTDEAINALSKDSPNAQWNAAQYLAAHPNESIPQLFRIVERQEPGWVYALTAIARSKDVRALPFLTHLLADNFFLKEADGTRKIFGLGTQNGCLVLPNLFGSGLADALGDLGDPRAIPALREAVEQGDARVRRSAYAALYKLGGVSLDDLFSFGSETQADLWDVLEDIGQRATESDPRFAISVFDRIIARFSDDPHRVASAHFWKMDIFEYAKDYDAALREADEVIQFTQYENLTRQARDAQGRIRTKMKQYQR